MATFCYILACILVHMALRFGAKYTAFWCILHCVLVQNTLRFGAYCDAFCGKMRCNNQQLGTIFLSFRMQIWGIFLQREMQKHSKWPKTEGISTQKMLKFHRLGAFYMAFGGYFLLEWFGRRMRFVKYVYRFNKSLIDDFGGKDDGYAAA